MAVCFGSMRRRISIFYAQNLPSSCTNDMSQLIHHRLHLNYVIFRVDLLYSTATVQIHGSLFWADAHVYIFFRTKFCFAMSMSTWHVSTYMSYVESQCYSIFFMKLIFWFFIQLTQVSVFFANAKYRKLTLKSLKTANFSCTFSIYHIVLSCQCTLFDPGNELSVIFS